jgi:serine O-acetyltransferase
MHPEDLWEILNREARALAEQEPLLSSYLHACIFSHSRFIDALSFILANKLSDHVTPLITLKEMFDQALNSRPVVQERASFDLSAVVSRDPAIDSYLTVLLNLKGFLSIQTHRIAHELWKSGRQELARFIQSKNSEVFGVDIHPACRIGKGIMFDHATGIVIGETAVIEDDVSLLQGVTLGGTGNESGDRHPKVRSGVMIGAGTKILGNIEIGVGAKVGANSVVLENVPAHSTVVGVPAKIVGTPTCQKPALTMDQNIQLDCCHEEGSGI